MLFSSITKRISIWLFIFLIGEITTKLIVSENNICKCYICDKNQIMFHFRLFDCKDCISWFHKKWNKIPTFYKPKWIGRICKKKSEFIFGKNMLWAAQLHVINVLQTLKKPYVTKKSTGILVPKADEINSNLNYFFGF